MPRTKLAAQADEKSTYVITLTFTDAAGATVTPSAVSWSLTDLAGAVINSRSEVVAVPAETVLVVLSGLDLAMQAGEGGVVQRLLTVQATYTSTEGSNLPYKAEYLFNLHPLVVVA